MIGSFNDVPDEPGAGFKLHASAALALVSGVHLAAFAMSPDNEADAISGLLRSGRAFDVRISGEHVMVWPSAELIALMPGLEWYQPAALPPLELSAQPVPGGRDAVSP